MSSLFADVALAPRDPILGLNEQFNADTRPGKVNLGVGVYYDEAGKLPLLKCVQAAEAAMAAAPKPRGYLPIDGIAVYDKAVQKLVFGQELNDETYAICRSDMMIKGQDASHITVGNSFSEDGHADRTFDYCLANPPFGVEWKKVEDVIKAEG